MAKAQDKIVETAPVDDYSFQSAMEHFKEQGGKAADMMSGQKLLYLKSGETHKLRILPGTNKPVEWFAACSRHYMGNASLVPIKRQGSRKSAICPLSISGQKCFVCDVRAYLEAVGSSAMANEVVARDVAIVNAYKANETEPSVGSFLITKTNINQLRDLWKEGYVFFHPFEGFDVLFRPVENMNLFTIQAAPKKTPANPSMMEQNKDLGEVLQSLMIPYETMKTWFIQPFVEVVDHFMNTGEAKPLDFKSLLSTTPSITQDDGSGTAASQPDAPNAAIVSPASNVTPGSVPSFITQLQEKVGQLSGQPETEHAAVATAEVPFDTK